MKEGPAFRSGIELLDEIDRLTARLAEAEQVLLAASGHMNAHWRAIDCQVLLSIAEFLGRPWLVETAKLSIDSLGAADSPSVVPFPMGNFPECEAESTTDNPDPSQK